MAFSAVSQVLSFILALTEENAFSASLTPFSVTHFLGLLYSIFVIIIFFQSIFVALLAQKFLYSVDFPTSSFLSRWEILTLWREQKYGIKIVRHELHLLLRKDFFQLKWTMFEVTWVNLHFSSILFSPAGVLTSGNSGFLYSV